MRVQLRFMVTVQDEAALREYANRRYRECWKWDLPEDATLGEILFEALVCSNENPSPDTYGIAIEDDTLQVEYVED